MAQISNANLIILLDKMARWAAEAEGTALASSLSTYAVTAPTGGIGVANTDVLAALKVAVAAYTDADQQADFVCPVLDLNNSQPILGSLAFYFWTKMRRALDEHMGRYAANAIAAGDISYLDAALRVLNAAVATVRAHALFAQYFGGLNPNNVFPATPITLATVVVTGASTATFTHIAALDSTLYGPCKLMVLNTKTEGLTSTVLTFPVAVKAGVPTSIAATITSQTSQLLTAFGDTTVAFTDCPVTSATISGGVSTDTFSVVAIPDRAINAA